MTWDAFLTLFAASGRLSPHTVRGYVRDLKLFLAFWSQEALAGPRHVEKRHLTEFYRAQKQSPSVSEATAGARLRSLLILLRWAVSQELLLLDPSRGWKVPKPNRPLPRVLTVDEVERVLQAPLQSPRAFIRLRDRALLELLYGTGMRGGEVLALNVDDLDLADASLRILGGKGKNRRLPLTDGVVVALRDYLDWILPRYAQTGETALFLTRSGERMNTRSLSQQLQRYGQALGIAGVTAHALRRALATHLVQGGAELVEIQRLLGHVDINSTVVYTRLYPTDLIRAHRQSHPRFHRRKAPHDA